MAKKENVVKIGKKHLVEKVDVDKDLNVKVQYSTPAKSITSSISSEDYTRVFGKTFKRRKGSKNFNGKYYWDGKAWRQL